MTSCNLSTIYPITSFILWSSTHEYWGEFYVRLHSANDVEVKDTDRILYLRGIEVGLDKKLIIKHLIGLIILFP
ncbi:MAG: hypothetical protein A2Z14_01935 [Chloroflexi bacterium RBG_16_48_8]|nr:MAG: hypothetical protein A2Z14_01935 [Chloroflexi bacterium RBG_16_48_8]